MDAFDLFLVRHGEAASQWGTDPDPGLSDLGREQAEAVCESLLGVLHDDARIVSSPLLRARETAGPLAEALGASIEIDHRFREIPVPASVTDRRAWIHQFARQTWESQSRSVLDWRDAAMDGLTECRSCTVIFAHFAVINAIVSKLTGRADTICFLPDNCSVTHVKQSGSEFQLHRLGEELQAVTVT